MCLLLTFQRFDQHDCGSPSTFHFNKTILKEQGKLPTNDNKTQSSRYV